MASVQEQYLKGFVFGFAIAMTVYSLSVGAYELYVGGEAARLVAKYYSYSMPITGTGGPASVAIDALPRDIYKNTKETAIVMLIFGAVAVVCTVITIGYSAYTKSKETFLTGIAISNAIVIVIPFCFSAFLTWKLHSLSDADEATWDFVDRGFINNLGRAEKLLMATVIPGCVWTVIGCILYFGSYK